MYKIDRQSIGARWPNATRLKLLDAFYVPVMEKMARLREQLSVFCDLLPLQPPPGARAT